MSQKRVAILISGGGSNMTALIRSMTADHPARVVLVVSNVADAGGLAKAQAEGVTTACVDHRSFKGDRAAFEAALNAKLKAASPDIICLAGFMRILSAEFIAMWQGKMLNIHPSLLPKYRGLDTHQRALDACEKDHGCTVHEVTAELDGGPVLAQTRIKIEPGDTADSLSARVLKAEHALYPKVLRDFATKTSAT